MLHVWLTFHPEHFSSVLFHFTNTRIAAPSWLTSRIDRADPFRTSTTVGVAIAYMDSIANIADNFLRTATFLARDYVAFSSLWSKSHYSSSAVFWIIFPPIPCALVNSLYIFLVHTVKYTWWRLRSLPFRNQFNAIRCLTTFNSYFRWLVYYVRVGTSLLCPGLVPSWATSCTAFLYK